MSAPLPYHQIHPSNVIKGQIIDEIIPLLSDFYDPVFTFYWLNVSTEYSLLLSDGQGGKEYLYWPFTWCPLSNPTKNLRVHFVDQSVGDLATADIVM